MLFLATTSSWTNLRLSSCNWSLTQEGFGDSKWMHWFSKMVLVLENRNSWDFHTLVITSYRISRLRPLSEQNSRTPTNNKNGLISRSRAGNYLHFLSHRTLRSCHLSLCKDNQSRDIFSPSISVKAAKTSRIVLGIGIVDSAPRSCSQPIYP